MQKSKVPTIIFIVLLIIYIYINQMYLSKFGNIYTFIINPLSFIVIAVLLKFFVISPYNTNRLKKDIMQYVLITILIYCIVYLVSGVFVGFGQNPYSTTIRGIIINLFVSGTIIFCREYIRYKLIKNVYKEDVKLIFILLVIVFTIQEFGIFNIFDTGFDLYTIFKQLFYKFIPILLKNILFTYIALKSDYMPAVLYDILYYLILWMAPILPKSPWVLEAILQSIFPLLLFLYIKYMVEKKDRFHLNEADKSSNPSTIIPLSVVLVTLIWFALGVFPIKPVGIASGSMMPELSVGDAAIIKKCSASEINKDDIIEYKMDGYTVIHRVINIYQKQGYIYFITKGDNNKSEDKNPVKEDQLIGKVILKVPYIALPSVWIHSLSGPIETEVETGK